MRASTLLGLRAKIFASIGLLVIGNFFFASQAMALIGVDAAVGQKSNKVKYDTVSQTDKAKTIQGSEYGIGVYIDPIPLVPFAFGLALSGYSYDRSKLDKEVIDEALQAADLGTTLDSVISSKVAGLLYGPSLKVWAPIPYIKPYLKYTYLMGSEITTLDDYDVHSNVSASAVTSSTTKGTSTSAESGSEILLGIGYSPVKFLSMFVEYAVYTGKTKTKDQKVENVTISGDTATSTTSTKENLTDEDKKSKSTSASSIRFGLSVGI
ncbi:MAG: hypothetical protein NTV34_12615 [Proteobacteria bacterium]|nr:hypothetical protein [Pseudomonadota bacterium]